MGMVLPWLELKDVLSTMKSSVWFYLGRTCNIYVQHSPDTYVYIYIYIYIYIFIYKQSHILWRRRQNIIPKHTSHIIFMYFLQKKRKDESTLLNN